MVHLSALVERIIPLLRQAAAEQSGLVRVALPCSLKDGTQMLEWLASQPLFPQFYWRHRDGAEEAAVCGAVCTFTDAEQAQEFIRKNDCPELRIWGLNAFGQV
ncbi:MAG: isochorismate synthase, partial [Hafnia sp.]